MECVYVCVGESLSNWHGATLQCRERTLALDSTWYDT